MLVLNTPQNPTGRVLEMEELEWIHRIVHDKDLLILSDECYKQALYDDRQHYSIAALPGMKNKTIIIYSFSKAYTMYGWRVGYAIANEDVIQRMIRIQSNTVSCPTSFAQIGALSALKDGSDHVAESLKRYRKLRDLAVEMLNDIEGVSCEIPEGGFWIFPDVSRISDPADPMIDYLLERHHIGLIPGSAFGDNAPGHCRIWYLHQEAYLQKGLGKLQVGIREYINRV